MRAIHIVSSVILVLGCAVAMPSSRADVDVKLLGAGTLSSLSDRGATSSSNGLGVGYGLLMTGRINRSWNFDFGGLVLDRRTQSTTFASRSSLMVPLIFAYRVLPGVRLDLGGYWDYGLQSAPAGYQASFYGALGGLSMDIPLIPGVGLVLGGRYLFQLSSLASAGATTRYSDMLFTAGFRLGENR